MIIGLGNDIIEISRIQKAILRNGQPFLDRIFTANEQRYCLKFKESARHFAGRWAAKEAIVKALGTGIGQKIGWLDIEILNIHTGQPQAVLSQQGEQTFDFPQILLSISHCKEYAAAVAIVQKGNGLSK